MLGNLPSEEQQVGIVWITAQSVLNRNERVLLVPTKVSQISQFQCTICRVAEKLKADIYFANPYSSWERGLNENFNGLLRQYIRKGTDLRTVTDKQIAEIERALNARPRKCLGFRQPVAIFNELRKAA